MALDGAETGIAQAGLALVHSGLASSVWNAATDAVQNAITFVDKFFGGKPGVDKVKADLNKT